MADSASPDRVKQFGAIATRCDEAKRNFRVDALPLRLATYSG
jgi:hypothetical protein